MRVFICGAGSFGTALAAVLQKEHDVVLYTIEADVYSTILATKKNAKYLPNVSLKVRVTMDLADMQECDCVILSIPATVVGDVAKKIKPYAAKKPLILTSKGLAKGGLLPTEALLRVIPKAKAYYMAGPCLSAEMMEHFTIVDLCGPKAADLAKKLSTQKLGFVGATHPKHAQLLAVYKNVFAFLAGLVEALDLGSNMVGLLLVRSLNEYMAYHKMSAKRFLSHVGLADLYTTSISHLSRNRTAGKNYFSTTSAIYTTESLALFKKLKNASRIFPIQLRMLMTQITQTRSKREVKRLLLDYIKNGKT